VACDCDSKFLRSKVRISHPDLEVNERSKKPDILRCQKINPKDLHYVVLDNRISTGTPGPSEKIKKHETFHRSNAHDPKETTGFPHLVSSRKVVRQKRLVSTKPISSGYEMRDNPNSFK
jgi:hypothetical protein